MTEPDNRRDFLTGKSLQKSIRKVGDHIADSVIGHTKRAAPTALDTLRLTVRAMACDFSIIMNAGEMDTIWDASRMLDLLEPLEQEMSVYRDDSDIARWNTMAFQTPQKVKPTLLRLLQTAATISDQTQGAFDLTTGPLIQLWRTCREESRVPQPEEIEALLESVGMRHVQLDADESTIRLCHANTRLNLGAIGKGYALDEIANQMKQQNASDFLLHGGRSSLVAQGEHVAGGWPVGIGNPLFTNQRLGTILLKNQAMATSGSNVQHYRVGSQRFGHILDPRTGWPADGMLSVTVLAPSAALADALSTAFYVMGVDGVKEYCQENDQVGAILVPPPTDRRIAPIVIGLDVNQIYWDGEQVIVPT